MSFVIASSWSLWALVSVLPSWVPVLARIWLFSGVSVWQALAVDPPPVGIAAISWLIFSLIADVDPPGTANDASTACRLVDAWPGERTSTLKLAVPVLPASSDAEHVTVVVPIRRTSPEATGAPSSERQDTEGAPLTASLAEAAKVTGAPAEDLASTAMSSGTVTAGAVVSRTITLKLAVPVLPASSDAEHVTVVVPIRRTSPEATGAPSSERQDTEGAPLTASLA